MVVKSTVVPQRSARLRDRFKVKVKVNNKNGSSLVSDDEGACDSAVQSWKHTDTHRCHNDSLLFGLKGTQSCDVSLLQQRDADAGQLLLVR